MTAESLCQNCDLNTINQPANRAVGICNTCLTRTNESVSRLFKGKVIPKLGDLTIRIPIADLPSFTPVEGFAHQVIADGKLLELAANEPIIELHHWLKRQIKGVPEGHVYFISQAGGHAELSVLFETADKQCCKLSLSINVAVTNTFLRTDFIHHKLITCELMARRVKSVLALQIINEVSNKTLNDLAQNPQLVSDMGSILANKLRGHISKHHWPFSILLSLQSITHQDGSVLVSRAIRQQIASDESDERLDRHELAAVEKIKKTALDAEVQTAASAEAHQHNVQDQSYHRALQLLAQETKHILRAKDRSEEINETDHLKELENIELAIREMKDSYDFKLAGQALDLKKDKETVKQQIAEGWQAINGAEQKNEQKNGSLNATNIILDAEVFNAVALQDFGLVFWQYLLAKVPELNDILTNRSRTISTIVYRDNFCSNVADISVLCSILSAMRRRFEHLIKPYSVLMTTLQESGQVPYRSQLIKSIFKKLTPGNELRFICHDFKPNDINKRAHHRKLMISFDDGSTVLLGLEWGMGPFIFDSGADCPLRLDEDKKIKKNGHRSAYQKVSAETCRQKVDKWCPQLTNRVFLQKNVTLAKGQSQTVAVQINAFS